MIFLSLCAPSPLIFTSVSFYLLIHNCQHCHHHRQPLPASHRGDCWIATSESHGPENLLSQTTWWSGQPAELENRTVLKNSLVLRLVKKTVRGRARYAQSAGTQRGVSYRRGVKIDHSAFQNISAVFLESITFFPSATHATCVGK